jgi:filamentous hemagglutinin family protein
MRDMMRFSKILLATTALVAVGSLALRAQAQTLPTGGSVASGQVAIGAPNAGRMTITQGSQNAIVNWQGFSIGQGGRVDIVQPNSSAAMLNRVTGQAPSTIAGQLNANGQVFLVNPNGIAITNSGVVNTGSFVASTLGISDGDFLSGRLRFQGNGASAAVSNAGSIQAAPGGYAALLGGRVDNSGTISVPLGRIGLGAGERVTLDLSGDGFLQVALPSAVGGDQALVSNSGRLSAPGGRVEIAAATAQAAARHAINMSGVVEANTVSGQAGSITFSGGAGGTVDVSGRVNASSATGRGGNVTVTGANIALRGAQVDASGATGGGRVRIGGDRQGQGDLPRAQRVSVDNASVIRADATTRGDGGDIVLWSEGRTDFAGSISARGGAEGGRGGEAEVSSRGVLNYTGFADLRAPQGAWGTLLLDPYNITISNGTQTADAGFTATTNDSVINAGTLITALGSANVTVSTGLAGTQAGDITLVVPLSWSSAGILTLQAAGGIALNGAVTAASGGLTLQAGGTISATEAISVARFELQGGAWVQNNATLPGFSATDFRITGGSFLRAAGGDGSAGAPYRLTDIYGVQGMGSSGALLGSFYRLANDIDASGTSAWNSGAGFVPVGTDAAFFAGNLNGAGYVINGLTINRPTTDYVGLIGYAGAGSSISNLGLLGGSVTGQNYVGGLVGHKDGGTITQAYATGAVTGSGWFVGGLVGANDFGTITQAFATGSVTGRSDFVGGLVGANAGSITQAYATGAVTGSSWFVGGLVGNNTGGSITQAYATGAVVGGNYVGGLVGRGEYSIITQSYWDTQTTGQSGSDGGTSLTTAQARTQAGYAGWDFGTVWYQAGDMRPILRSEAAAPVGGVISIRNLNQLQLMGANLSGSYRLAGNIDATPSNGSNAAGIWGSGGFVPVGTVGDSITTHFTVSLDGAGYVINGLTINRPTTDFVGLIGYAGVGSSISNLGLVGGSVTGRSRVGGLVGYNNAGTITQAYATSAVVGGDYVGGLVGISNGGSITQAYATGAVTGQGWVGGLVGYNNAGIITQAYATGAVTGGKDNVGGLVGINYGTITQAYATGAVTGIGRVGGLVGYNDVGTITQAYWDTQTTGQSGSAGGTGLTTAQMQDITSFRTTYAGWDFNTVWSPPNQVGQNNNSATGFYPQLHSLSPAVAVSASLSASSREYGDSNPGASFSYTGLRSGDSIATGASITGGPGAAANVGTYTISSGGVVVNNAGSGANYRMIYVPSALAVTPRLITVRANDLARNYGQSNPPLTYSISSGSLVNGDRFTGSLFTSAGLQSEAGSYVISQGNLSLSANYAMTLVPGTLTVRRTLMSNGVFGSTLLSAWGQQAKLMASHEKLANQTTMEFSPTEGSSGE